MVIIAMAQILMIFNISSLQVSIEVILASFSTLASTMGTAIVTYSVAAGCQSRPSRHLGCIYRSCWRGKALKKPRESPLCIAPRLQTRHLLDLLRRTARSSSRPALPIELPCCERFLRC